MIGSYSLSEIAERCKGQIFGDNVEVSYFSSDTRSLTFGDAFIALKGKNFDGNDLIDDAIGKGAVALVVSKKLSCKLPLLYVEDSLQALAAIALITRERSEAKIIGITGSQGKTTVKEMTGSILSEKGQTLITSENRNNTIGVPLTLFNLDKRHEFAVIEMGADRRGEIKFSADAVKPEIAVITNANDAHVEGFGSLQGIVEAKGEIIDATSPGGSVILNNDDPHIGSWIERCAKRKVIKFSGRNPDANYFASNVQAGSDGPVTFRLNTPVGSRLIMLKLLGNHNVINAVAASAAAMETGADLQQIKAGLEKVRPVSGRLFPLEGINECRVIDDTYNASPSSFKAAIDAFRLFPGEKILVAGDMRELGSESKKFHKAVGEYAAKSGIEKLWAVGDLSQHMAKAFGPQAKHFASMDELVNECRLTARPNLVFLIKGSRGSRMEIVANELSTARRSNAGLVV
mgnify:FL=1